MDEKKIELLLEKLTFAASEFAYETSEPDFCVKICISCHDGWAQATKV